MPRHPEIFLDHRVAAVWGIEPEYLTQKGRLLDTTLAVARQLGLTTLESFTHKFKPVGLSVILVISQSHLAVHTWPEFEYMHIDVLSCAKNANLDNLKTVLQENFHPRRIIIKKIEY